MSINPLDHYWEVGGDISKIHSESGVTKVFSSKRNAYVSTDDAEYQAWLKGIRPQPSRIANEAELAAVLEQRMPGFKPNFK